MCALPCILCLCALPFFLFWTLFFPLIIFQPEKRTEESIIYFMLQRFYFNIYFFAFFCCKCCSSTLLYIIVWNFSLFYYIFLYVPWMYFKDLHIVFSSQKFYLSDWFLHDGIILKGQLKVYSLVKRCSKLKLSTYTNWLTQNLALTLTLSRRSKHITLNTPHKTLASNINFSVNVDINSKH